MNVQGLEHQLKWEHFKAARHGEDQQANAGHRHRAERTQEQASTDQSQTGSAWGVTRLLQEGHFQRSAEVQLQFNFGNDIQQHTNRKSVAALENGTEEVSANLEDKLKELFGSSKISDALGEFAASISTALEQITADAKSGQTTSSSALNAIKSAFSDLVSDLQNALGASETETPQGDKGNPETAITAETAALTEDETESAQVTAGAAEVEATSAEAAEQTQEVEAEETGDENIVPSDFNSALNSLKTWLADHVSDMQKDIEAAQSFPGISRHHGHRRGHAQSMAIYITMNFNTAQPTPTSDQAAAIDAMV